MTSIKLNNCKAGVQCQATVSFSSLCKSCHPHYCPGPPERLSALSVFLFKSFFYGAFVWARRALSSQKRRFPARAVVLEAVWARGARGGAEVYEDAGDSLDYQEGAYSLTGLSLAVGAAETTLTIAGGQVRKTPSWPRSWANFSLF